MVNGKPFVNIEVLVDHEYITKATEIISQAKSEILLSTFKIQSGTNKRTQILREMVDLLVEKLRQGVRVLLLMNWKENRKGVPKTNEPVANLLRAAGADVRYLKQGRCCHAKILLVDNSKLILGSHNWSAASLQENFEMSLFIESAELARKIKDRWLRSYTEAKRWL